MDGRKRLVNRSVHTFGLRYPDLWALMTALRKYTVRHYFGNGSDAPDFPQHEDINREEVPFMMGAELVSSEYIGRNGNRHLIAVDIDKPAWLLQSSSHGMWEPHHHLYVEVEASWDDYLAWLEASAKIGLLEPGYVSASKARGATFLRLPWIRKGQERKDRERALGQWLTSDSEGDLNQPLHTERKPLF